MRNIISRNPFSGKILEQIPFASHEQITKQLENARLGFEIQSNHQTKQKISMVRDLIAIVEKRKVQLANIITQQTGKPIIQSQFQVKKALSICAYYTAHHQALFSINVKTQAKKKTLLKCLPLGTVYCVLPPMYPLLQNFYKTIPQLILGNTVLVRHSHNTPGTAKLIEKIMKRVGFQSGQYQNIWNYYDQSATIIKNINVVGVNFSGTTKNGSKLAALAGKYLKKYQIQGDQNNVLILFQDGNVELAVSNLLKSGFFNSGQGLSPKKIIVHHSLLQQFQDILIDKIKSMVFGNPHQKQTNVGPIIQPAHYQQLKTAKNQFLKSSKLIYERQDVTIPFFSPCILECYTRTPDIHVDGPLFQLFRFQQQAEIQPLLSRFSNVSSVYLFTNTKKNALIQHLAVGNLLFNTVNHYDPNVPLGGSSSSGFWKEGWQQSLRAFANIKTQYIN